MDDVNKKVLLDLSSAPVSLLPFAAGLCLMLTGFDMWYWITALAFFVTVCFLWRRRDIKVWNGGVCRENGIKWYVFCEYRTCIIIPTYGLRSGDIKHPVHKRVIWFNPDKTASTVEENLNKGNKNG